jgi:hypothetical protein
LPQALQWRPNHCVVGRRKKTVNAQTKLLPARLRDWT